MLAHSVIPATLADVPIFLAFEHRHHGPLCVACTGEPFVMRLRDALPLLPGPTIREATRIFAPQRFGRDLAGKLTAEHDRPVRVGRVAIEVAPC